MDMNSSGQDKSEHMIMLGDDFPQNFGTKSFRCSFCKRGFSNAQALGGHMNIHRRDRAKLREFSDENLLSLEISTVVVDCDDSPVLKEKLGVENDHQSRVKAVPPPLFVEEVGDGGGERREVELKYGVDLELRLGPEPHHHAKSKP